MLASLSIRDMVLIDRLDLHFGPGLNVLTGETGAGKSILLDSLSLAIGAKADSNLVRHGAKQGTVTAAFDVPPDHPARQRLADQGLDSDPDDPVTVRRVVNADGRSRAYVNDQPASVGLLRTLGEVLLEIHGQFESHSLLNPATHRGVLDALGGLEAEVRAVREAWQAWRTAHADYAEARDTLDKARAEEDWLRHAVDELTALDPRADEEETLSERRNTLMHAEKVVEAMNTAYGELTGNRDPEGALQAARRRLEAVADKAEGRLDEVIAGLDRAAVELAEATANLERASNAVDLDPAQLEQVEDRLVALRDAARKYDVAIADLPAHRDTLAERLEAIDHGSDHLATLARAEEEARAAYEKAARALSKARAAAAERLDADVAAELPPLKLDRARFVTVVEEQDEANWSAEGLDRVEFRIATVPSAPPGPIARVASGGELARLMLALKVILARTSPVPSLIFDEVDTGIGGATAHAVGERLARLADGLQVLVVTHSPQVAARGTHHFVVEKTDTEDGAVRTTVAPLADADRREEVARMLAGESVTDEARAAAGRLLAGEEG